MRKTNMKKPPLAGRSVILSAACEPLERRMLLTAGSLDATFNGSGMLSLGAFNGYAHDVAIQPDGKLVIVGERYVDNLFMFGVVRLQPDGSLDPTFDDDGVLDELLPGIATSVAFQSDGTIVVAGYAADKLNFAWPKVVRISPAGEVLNGYVFHPGMSDDYCFDVAIQSDDKILLVGSAGSTTPGADRLFVARIHANIIGLLDTSFDGDGIAHLNIGQATSGNSIAIQPDGNIVVAGNTFSGDWVFARYLPSGALDPSFGFGGHRVIDFVGGFDVAYDVALQPDGKVVMAGELTAPAPAGRNFLVARYLSSGLEDFPFGGGASARDLDFANSSDTARSLTIQSDGKIVLAGSTIQGSQIMAFARFDKNGAVDNSFGPSGNGQMLVDFPGAISDGVRGSAMDGDGRVIAAGSTNPGFSSFHLRFGLARILPGQYPFHGAPFVAQQRIEAEQYDNGGPGDAYFDTTPNANEAAPPFISNYRPGSGVDLETDSDGGNNVHVGYTRPGEYLRYTVTVPASGQYELQFRVASNGVGGTFHVEFNGVDVTGPISIPDTGGQFNFTTITRSGINLNAGAQTATIVFDTPGANGQVVGNLNWWRFGDFTPPQVLSSSYLFDTAPHRLVYQFSEPVPGAVTPTSLHLENLSTGMVVPASSLTVSYDSPTNTFTFTFPGFAGGILPEGDYRATLIATHITDPAGNFLAQDVITDFFFFPADANHDRHVNLDDFNILAANFGQSPRTFTQGDYNYDTVVNLNDFNLLAERFGSTLVTPAAGPEFRVNGTTTGSQYRPGIVSKGSGEFVVVWSGRGPGGGAGGNDEIFGQRYDAAGAAQGGFFRINSTTSNIQEFPAIAMNNGGEFVVAWESNGQDGNGRGVYAQRFANDGSPLGGELRVNTTTSNNQAAPSVAYGNNGFVVAWESVGQDGNGRGVYAQRYANNGTPAGAEFRVNTFTTDQQAAPSVAMDDNGNFIVVWHSAQQDGGGYGIYAQRYNSSGTPQGAEFRVNSTTAGAQRLPQVAMDSEGDFVIVWQSYGQDGSGSGIYSQRYNAASIPQGIELRINATTANDQTNPAVALNDSGQFVVTWDSFAQDGSNAGVYARLFGSAGTPITMERQINLFTTGAQQLSAVSIDDDGDFVVAWESDDQDGDLLGIFARQFDTNVNPSYAQAVLFASPWSSETQAFTGAARAFGETSVLATRDDRFDELLS